MINKALFLDRDGVINYDYGHVHRRENFDFIEGIFELSKVFHNNGWLIVVVTNQAGIAKGYYTENDFIELTEWMTNEFQLNEVNLSKVYYCPHHPEGVGNYRETCSCRKPEAGLIKKAELDFNIDLSKSIIIGDKISDVQAGMSAGIKQCLLLKSRYHNRQGFDSLSEITPYLTRKVL